ncbi:MAG: glycosyltransferase [Solirubrobacteraceae bacterium]
MRALVVTNMYPSAVRPALGSFVADQVGALLRSGEAEVQVWSFEPGGTSAYAGAARRLRAQFGGGRGAGQAHGARFDVVHAHFGLTLWPALAVPARTRAVTLHGTDLTHPRSRAITLAGLRLDDLVAAVSAPLAATIPRWAVRAEPAVLPCGVALDRFEPIDRADARRALGLDPDRPQLLFPADPARAEKRFDQARAVAGDVPLLTLGDVDPARVPLYVNAANAVLVPSDREGYGLAVLEALACNVPVLATPVGIHGAVLDGVRGTICAPFDAAVWREALAPHLEADDPRIEGRARAEPHSSDAMARRVLAAWRQLLSRAG